MRSTGVAALLAVMLVLAGCGVDGRSASQKAAAKASASRSRAAAAQEKAAKVRQQAQEERRKKASAYRECKAVAGPLDDKLTDLDSRLSVGMQFSEYRDKVGSARAAYDKLIREAKARGGVSQKCIDRVLTPLESALNHYISAYQVWNNCDYPCDVPMVDSSGHGLSGAISSKVLVGRRHGHSGVAYGFTGDGGRVTVPDNHLLDPGRDSFQVQLYFKSSTKPSRSVGDYDLIRKGLVTTKGGDWKMEVLRGGRVFCYFRGSSATVTVKGSTNVVDGRWHRLGCRSTSSGVSALVDGKIQSTSLKTPGNISNSASVRIGAKNATEDQTTGVLDDIVITTG